jgi:hypothetical protein
VVGSFGFTIPVETSAEILPSEGATLAIFKWRLSLMSPSNRWYPVMERYINYVEAWISGMGGNPATIKASPSGAPGALIPIGAHPVHKGDTGKVEGVIYDRFGDFEGFHLETEAGKEVKFRSREPRIEELVRYALKDRVVITVLPERAASRTDFHLSSCDRSEGLLDRMFKW